MITYFIARIRVIHNTRPCNDVKCLLRVSADAYLLIISHDAGRVLWWIVKNPHNSSRLRGLDRSI